VKLFYEVLYRYFRAPWDIGPRVELVELVEGGRLEPCRVIDLGSGTASNCIYLAERGFEVTGVDFSPAAIERGQSLARQAGVSVNFVVDDLTDLKHVSGTFDLLIDYGTLDDLRGHQRDLYVKNVIPLSRPGSQFLLYAFEWKPRGWERLVYSSMGLDLGEARSRFLPYFHIEEIAREQKDVGFPRGYAVYLMKRLSEAESQVPP
jgi:SAM-dependent methyltransferase